MQGSSRRRPTLAAARRGRETAECKPLRDRTRWIDRQLEYQRAIFDAVNLRDVGMVQRREQLGLALKSRQPLSVIRERIGQNFDRDFALQARIPRAIDLAHTAGADEGDDFVGAEASAGANGHFCNSLSQFKTMVIGGVESPSLTFIKNRPSGATSYWARARYPLASTFPPVANFV
jgi:hypothetical protein